MRIAGTYLALLTAACPILGQELPDHASLDAVLDGYLRGKYVDYAGLTAHRGDLDAYLTSLAGVDSAALARAPRTARMALWINAYNACAIELVVDHYPIKKAGFPQSLVRSLAGVPDNSVRQIPDTWDRRFCEVAGAARSLDQIEHEIIRPMGDPRIHFAVNCASRSCPTLAPHAYTAAGLNEELDGAVRRFVSDPEQYRLERGDAPVIRVNKILDWYADDFGGTGGVIAFLLPYLTPEDAAYVRANPDIDLEYFHYDWTLNDTALLSAGR